MNIHLFATDISGIEIVDLLPNEDTVTCIIVPSNRVGSTKVRTLLDAAESRSLPVVIHERGQVLSKGLSSADAGISWLYSQIISTTDLVRYPQGILNMHGGKIPEYRGASVLHWSIINGERELGITWHELVEAVDAGPIWVESTIPIPPSSTALEMRSAMISEGLGLFPKAWERFREPDARPVYPDLSKGRVWRQRRPSDGLIEPGWPEGRVRDMVRALCPPWPPAYIESDDCKAYVSGISPVHEPEHIPYPTAEGTTLFLVPGKEVAAK